MSSYGYVYLEKLNTETGKWEWYGLWDKNDNNEKFRRLPLWEGQGYIRDILFDNYKLDLREYANIITKDEKGFYKLSDFVKKRAFGDGKDDDVSKPDVYWISYGDLYLYLQKYGKIEDPYEELEDEDGKIYSQMIENPLKILLDNLNMVVGMKWDYIQSFFNEFRFVFWIEW